MNTTSLGSTVITQVGIIVRDIEATSRAWADVFGLPVPPVILTDPLEQAQTDYRGAPTEARAKLAFFQMGAVSVELIEPIGGPSTWQEFLDAHGEGVHHLAFEVQGMTKAITYLAGKGMPLVQKGEYTGGRYAYNDASDPLKVILELLENDK
jgi:methylmalonyl-CoA/ethylmalonyl-CoA epimerase